MVEKNPEEGKFGKMAIMKVGEEVKRGETGNRFINRIWKERGRFAQMGGKCFAWAAGFWSRWSNLWVKVFEKTLITR